MQEISVEELTKGKKVGRAAPYLSYCHLLVPCMGVVYRDIASSALLQGSG